MPCIKLYPNGLTAGIAPMKNNHERAKRGDATGWSPSAARRNVAFLRSVVPSSLSGYGYTLTLTVRDCPESSELWRNARRAFVRRLERRGLIRLHWVTEWQRRGVPHMHCIAYFKEAISPDDIIQMWLVVTWQYGSGFAGQHVVRVNDLVGWFKYLAKHAARGAKHYQRAAQNVPDGWVKVGRVWGHVGNWECDDGTELNTSLEAFHAYRRLCRSYLLAEARTASNRGIIDWYRVKYVRRMLRCNDVTLSRVRGVSEWIPFDTALDMAQWLKSQGYRFEA